MLLKGIAVVDLQRERGRLKDTDLVDGSANLFDVEEAALERRVKGFEHVVEGLVEILPQKHVQVLLVELVKLVSSKVLHQGADRLGVSVFEVHLVVGRHHSYLELIHEVVDLLFVGLAI